MLQRGFTPKNWGQLQEAPVSQLQPCPAACLGEGWEQHTTPGFVLLRLLVLVPVPALPVFKDPVYCLGSKYPRKGGGWEETERKVNSVI